MSAVITPTTPFPLKTSIPNKSRLAMFQLFAPHCLDSYKLGHPDQYPTGTEFIYSNFTARSDNHLDIPAEYNDHKYVIWGVYGAWKEIVALWDQTFFNKPKDECLAKYAARVPAFSGKSVSEKALKRLGDLHDLGYLPLRVKSIKEGSRVNIGIPFFTIVNTLPDYYWLTNALETVISNEMWKPITVATLAYTYRKILDDFAEKTDGDMTFVPWQGHCFADRGMSGMMDAAKTGGGHSLSFWGSDSVSTFDWLDFMYKGSETFIGGSVPATEHSVMCVDGSEGEFETIERVTTEVYDDGVVSFVGDTYDYWKMLTEYIPRLKDKILARKFSAIGLSKVVVRPDSGDPADIICGTARAIPELTTRAFVGLWMKVPNNKMPEVVYCQGKYYSIVESMRLANEGKDVEFTEIIPTPQQKGSIGVLWDIFGGDINDTSFKTLLNRIGMIYGDSITPHRCLDICRRLAEKDFVSTIEVLGIGSYTYQYITRDTLGMAIKGTYAVVKSKGHAMFKDPKTDSGIKKSAKGLVKVLKSMEHGTDGKDVEKYNLVDQIGWDEEDTGELELMFENGNFLYEATLAEARTRLGV